MTTRKERRWQLRQAGMLKVKNMYGMMSEVGQMWYNKTREQGVQISTQRRALVEKQREEFLANKEASIKEGYEAFGYSSERIELMLEAWRLTAIKYKETYREDRKAARAILRKANELK
tara:strand:+ start:4902 stop:5255 length:354 start_codon:yes stop_codon:yes gene_type:complete